MLATILSYLTMAALKGVAGSLWKGFCDFIATPIGAAVIAGFVMFTVGVVHEKHVVNAKWEAKWAAAEAKAEQDRLERDAKIKLAIEMNANQRIAALDQRRAELEKKVNDYALEEEKQRALGSTAPGCLTDDGDAGWLRDIQRHGVAKPKAGGWPALRLRTYRR